MHVLLYFVEPDGFNMSVTHQPTLQDNSITFHIFNINLSEIKRRHEVDNHVADTFSFDCNIPSGFK